jgi:hypothetical protein
MTSIKIDHDELTISLTNMKTENKVTIDAEQLDQQWQFFSTDEHLFFEKLCLTESGETVEMLASDCKQFFDLAEKFKQAVEEQNADKKAKKEWKPDPQVKEEEPKPLLDFVILTYDIAEDSNVGDPCPILWRHGFRFNKSCWWLPIGHLSLIQDLLNLWDANNVDYEFAEVTERRHGIMKEKARKAIGKECVRIGQSLIQRIANADEDLKRAMDAHKAEEACLTKKQIEKKHSYRESRIKSTIKDAQDRLNNAVASFILFEEEGKIDEVFKGLREAIAAKQLVFNLEYERRRRQG